MTEKHTPGPWSIGKYGDVTDATGEVVRAKGLALTRGAEAEANARLIAAAPDMLAALKAVLRSAETGKSRAASEALAEAAISKATSIPIPEGE